MVTFHQLAAFALVSFVVVVIPGPSVMFVIGRALAHGRRTALASVIGNAVGVWAVAVCVALGIGVLLERSALAFMVLKYAGAAYLVWLGIQAIRKRRSVLHEMVGSAPPHSELRVAGEGFVVGITNPKAFILFAALLPPFVDRTAGHIPVQMIVLSLVSFVIAIACDSVWAVGASAARAWFARSPRRTELVGGCGGLCMVGLGLSVAVTGRKD